MYCKTLKIRLFMTAFVRLIGNTITFCIITSTLKTGQGYCQPQKL